MSGLPYCLGGKFIYSMMSQLNRGQAGISLMSPKQQGFWKWLTQIYTYLQPWQINRPEDASCQIAHEFGLNYRICKVELTPSALSLNPLVEYDCLDSRKRDLSDSNPHVEIWIFHSGDLCHRACLISFPPGPETVTSGKGRKDDRPPWCWGSGNRGTW